MAIRDKTFLCVVSVLFFASEDDLQTERECSDSVVARSLLPLCGPVCHSSTGAQVLLP